MCARVCSEKWLFSWIFQLMHELGVVLQCIWSQKIKNRALKISACYGIHIVLHSYYAPYGKLPRGFPKPVSKSAHHGPPKTRCGSVVENMVGHLKIAESLKLDTYTCLWLSTVSPIYTKQKAFCSTWTIARFSFFSHISSISSKLIFH